MTDYTINNNEMLYPIEMRFEMQICKLYKCERLCDPKGMASADRYSLLLNHPEIQTKMIEIINEKVGSSSDKSELLTKFEEINGDYSKLENFVESFINATSNNR